MFGCLNVLMTCAEMRVVGMYVCLYAPGSQEVFLRVEDVTLTR